MARSVREANLATRTARSRLPVSAKPFWRALERGLHLGYRRRETGGSWIARRRTDEGVYREGRLGLADDLQNADGERVLDFSQAQIAARNWWLTAVRFEQGLGAPISGPYTVARACSDYLDDYRRRGGKATGTINGAFLNHVMPAFGELPVSKLTPRVLQNWHWRIAEQPRLLRTRSGEERKRPPIDVTDPERVRVRRASANRILSYLKAALNHAWREGRVHSDDAWRRVKPFRGVEAPVIRYLTEPEITRLLEHCDAAFRDLVLGALLTGCRYGELTRLTVGDYNRSARVMSVRIAKGGKVRHVTLTEEALVLFDRLVSGRSSADRLFQRPEAGPWKAGTQVRPMKLACRNAGIEGAGFHILRHTHASHLAMRGVPMAVIAKQLGHAGTRMTERHYAHVAPNYVADTIRKNFPRLETRNPITLLAAS